MSHQLLHYCHSLRYSTWDSRRCHYLELRYIYIYIDCGSSKSADAKGRLEYLREAASQHEGVVSMLEKRISMLESALQRERTNTQRSTLTSPPPTDRLASHALTDPAGTLSHGKFRHLWCTALTSC